MSAEEAARLRKVELQSHKKSDTVIRELEEEKLIHDAHAAGIQELQEMGTSMKHKLIKGHQLPKKDGKYDAEAEYLDEMNWSNRLYADHFRKMANFTKVRV